MIKVDLDAVDADRQRVAWKEDDVPSRLGVFAVVRDPRSNRSRAARAIASVQAEEGLSPAERRVLELARRVCEDR